MSKITLQGILYDEKSSFARGPALAPPLIREAYHSNSANYYAEDGNEIKPNLFEDLGDFEVNEYLDIVAVTQANLNAQKPILTLGGDHSITYPVLKAINKTYGKISILHIDAHGDLYQNFEGDIYSHACPFYNILNDGITDDLTQVGIRTLNQEQRNNASKFDVNIYEMKDFKDFKMPKFKNPLYLSLDIDALDPAFAPGVSHHEPGGLSTREVLGIIQEIDVPLIGADIVEYNPTRDLNGVTAMVCAKFLREIAAKMI